MRSAAGIPCLQAGEDVNAPPPDILVAIHTDDQQAFDRVAIHHATHGNTWRLLLHQAWLCATTSGNVNVMDAIVRWMADPDHGQPTPDAWTAHAAAAVVDAAAAGHARRVAAMIGRPPWMDRWPAIVSVMANTSSVERQATWPVIHTERRQQADRHLSAALSKNQIKALAIHPDAFPQCAARAVRWQQMTLPTLESFARSLTRPRGRMGSPS